MNIPKRKLTSGLLVLALCSASVACDDEKKSEEKTLATIDGMALTQSEWDAYLKFKRVSAKNKKQNGRMFDAYVERERLALAIGKQKQFDQSLVDAEVRELRKEIVISRYFDQFLNEKVTDQAVRSYYDAHQADYEQKKIHVAHILIRTNRRMTADERKAKLTSAQEAHGKLQAGEDFAAVAKAVSEDRVSSRKGGDLGWIKQGGVDPKFSKVVFELGEGKVSEPFESAFGFHVAKVLEDVKVVKKPFRLVSGDIRHKLRAQAKKAELARLVGEVKVERKAAAPGAASGSAKPAAPKAKEATGETKVNPKARKAG